MKKGFLKVVTAGLVVASSVGLVACSIENDDELKYSIYNYDNTYTINETFSLSGAKLKITNKDGSETEITITDDMIKSLPDMSTVGTKTITIVYDGNEFTLTIEVLEASVTNYQITGYETSYYTNDTFNVSNLRLKLFYDNGTDETKTVTSSMIQQMPDMTTAGTKTVTILYGGESYSFTISVVEPRGTGIQVLGFEELYDINTKLELSEIKIKVDYEDGTHAFVDVDESMIDQMPNMSIEGIKNICVTYNGQPIPISFEVKDIAKAEMMEKIKNFMNDYNSADVKTSGIKINVEGTAKYLEDNVEFNEVLYNATMSSLNNLDGYKIYKPNDVDIYVLIKEFDSMEELENGDSFINLFGVDYIVFDMYNGNVERWYNTINSDAFYDLYAKTEEMTEISLDKFLANAIQTTHYAYFDGHKEITVFNSKLAQSIYKAITNAVVNSTMDIKKEDILSARDNLTAQLDIIKTLQNINTNITNIDFYNHFVNDMLLPESNSTYVKLARTYITHLFEITDQTTIDELDYALTTDIKKIRNNQLQDLKTTYNMIIELNNIIQESDGNASSLEKLDTIVSGIDSQDKHMLSKFVYSCRDFASVYMCTFGETTDYEEATSGNRWVYDCKYSDHGAVIYRYRDKISVENEDELVEEYYAGLKSLVERFENIADYTNVKTFAYDIISDMRAMDKVVQELESNGYESDMMNVYITFTIRGAIEEYVEMYDANVIADIIDMLGMAEPEGYSLPSNLVDALKDCSDTIYLAFGKSEIDYIKLIEDICDRLELEKDYYIEKYNAGEMTIFADVFDKYMGDLSEFEGAELEFYTAIKASCNYLDSIFVQGTDRTELMNEIHKAIKSFRDYYSETAQWDSDYEYVLMITDFVACLTDSEKDFNTNFKEVLTEYKQTVREVLKIAIGDVLYVDHLEEAENELDQIINYHLTAYLKDEFVIGDLVADMNEFVDRYCEQDVRTYVKSVAILSILVMNYGEDIDYNELLGGIELPNEIKDVDFNKLIKETLKDKETYDILSLQDVKVDYITDEDGNITKEILTISLNANYDILLSSMDAKVSLTIEINF